MNKNKASFENFNFKNGVYFNHSNLISVSGNGKKCSINNRNKNENLEVSFLLMVIFIFYKVVFSWLQHGKLNYGHLSNCSKDKEYMGKKTIGRHKYLLCHS